MATPHIPVVTRVMKAMRAKIEQISVDDLAGAMPGGEDRIRHLGYLAPPSRPPVTMMEQAFPQNVAELIEKLQNAGVLD